MTHIGWRRLDAEDFVGKRVVSRGWVVYEDKNVVVVSGTLEGSPGDWDVGDPLVIPKGCVLYRKAL